MVHFLLICDSIVFSLWAISVFFFVPRNVKNKNNVEHAMPVGFKIFLLLIFQL